MADYDAEILRVLKQLLTETKKSNDYLMEVSAAVDGCNDSLQKLIASQEAE